MELPIQQYESKFHRKLTALDLSQVKNSGENLLLKIKDIWSNQVHGIGPDRDIVISL